MNKIDYQTGDIGLSYSPNLPSKIILWFTSGHTQDAKKSHAYLMGDEELVVEPLASGKICINDVSEYENVEHSVYRLSLTPVDKRRLKFGIIGEVNKGYGFTKLPLFVLDSMATKILSLFGRKTPVFFFTKYFGISSFKVCSQFVVWAIHKFTNYRLRDQNGAIVNWRTVSPDRLEDLLKLPINEAVLIHSQEAI